MREEKNNNPPERPTRESEAGEVIRKSVTPDQPDRAPSGPPPTPPPGKDESKKDG